VKSSSSRSLGLHEELDMVLYLLFYVMILSYAIKFISLSLAYLWFVCLWLVCDPSFYSSYLSHIPCMFSRVTHLVPWQRFHPP
jgi:hypothetical protein